jgi:phosphate ABC transporter permease protein PstC
MLRSTNRIGKTYVLVSTIISALVIVLVFAVLVFNSWQAIVDVGWNLFSVKWNAPSGEFGILSMCFGTVVVTLIALLLAVPLGVLTAIFTSEMLPAKFRIPVKSLLELLAGIPSIIYGLIGIAFFAIWIQDLFELQSGRTILTAGILLAIMILPTIITLVDDALHNIPKQYHEAALGLGLYKYEIIKNMLLPIAKADIYGAILLAFGRALGETMAVMLVIGSIDKIPNPFFDVLSSGQTITSKLGREIAETSFGSVHFSAMIFMGLVLFVFVFIITLFAQQTNKKRIRLYE